MQICTMQTCNGCAQNHHCWAAPISVHEGTGARAIKVHGPEDTVSRFLTDERGDASVNHFDSGPRAHVPSHANVLMDSSDCGSCKHSSVEFRSFSPLRLAAHGLKDFGAKIRIRPCLRSECSLFRCHLYGCSWRMLRARRSSAKRRPC